MTVEPSEDAHEADVTDAADATPTEADDVAVTDAVTDPVDDAPSTETDAADATPTDADDVAVTDAVDDAPSTETDGADEVPNEDLRFVVVEVTNVSFPIPSPSPMVHLREADAPFRALEFPIGLAEAQAIGLALQKERAPRPSTHELLASVVIAAGCDVIAVRITGERSGTLLAELDLMTIRGREVLDCRPTDALAVALRQTVPAPILVETSLLDFG